jgi:hypothetical protein
MTCHASEVYFSPFIHHMVPSVIYFFLPSFLPLARSGSAADLVNFASTQAGKGVPTAKPAATSSDAFTSKVPHLTAARFAGHRASNPKSLVMFYV